MDQLLDTQIARGTISVLSSIRRALLPEPQGTDLTSNAPEPEKPDSEPVIELMLSDQDLVLIFEHLTPTEVLQLASVVNKRW